MKPFLYLLILVFFTFGIEVRAYGGLLDFPFQEKSMMEPPPTDTFVIQAPPNDQTIFCLDTTNLPGPLTVVDTFTCDTPLEFVTISFDENSACLTIDAGNVNGLDVICIEVCSTNPAQCDTTRLFILVESMEPQANADEVMTAQNAAATIDVLANDDFLTDVTLEITNQPPNGTVVINPDNTVTYIPDLGFCGTDLFTYTICTHPTLCDEAPVTVLVGLPCSQQELVFYSSFSPNGDGINDFLVIEGIENFPGSVLRVFNRWGVQVFEGRDYNNDWDGRWNDKILPDGTYFYYLDDGQGNEFSGFTVIYR